MNWAAAAALAALGFELSDAQDQVERASARKSADDVESYIGAENGPEGVKLEQQARVSERGVEVLSRFPFDDALLGREA